MKQLSLQLKSAVLLGIKASFKTSFWIFKMMVPITLAVSILKWAGVIDSFSNFVAPLFKHIGITGEGVVVFITSMSTTLYSTIAVIATLDIDYRSATILAVMGLLCHNIIMETIIQRKAGASALFVFSLRITSAIFMAWLLNVILPASYDGKLIITQVASTDHTLLGTISQWGMQMLELMPYMFSIILILNIVQQILRGFDLLKYIALPILPLMKFFGLNKDSAFLWIVLNTLGITYGGATIIEEIERGNIDKREAKLVNSHAAVSHSLLEDTLLFVALGLSLFWLIVPRVIWAIVVVWSQRLWYSYKDKRSLSKELLNNN